MALWQRFFQRIRQPSVCDKPVGNHFLLRIMGYNGELFGIPGNFREFHVVT